MVSCPLMLEDLIFPNLLHPEVHTHIHRSLRVFPILSHTNSVHILTLYLLKTDINIFPPTIRFSTVFLPNSSLICLLHAPEHWIAHEMSTSFIFVTEAWRELHKLWTCGTVICCHCYPTTQPVSSFDSTYVGHQSILYILESPLTNGQFPQAFEC